MKLVMRWIVRGAAGAAVVACVFVIGAAATSHPGETAPSAVKKLYDPMEL